MLNKEYVDFKMMFKDLTSSNEIRDIHVKMDPQWDVVRLSI